MSWPPFVDRNKRPKEKREYIGTFPRPKPLQGEKSPSKERTRRNSSPPPILSHPLTNSAGSADVVREKPQADTADKRIAEPTTDKNNPTPPITEEANGISEYVNCYFTDGHLSWRDRGRSPAASRPEVKKKGSPDTTEKRESRKSPNATSMTASGDGDLKASSSSTQEAEKRPETLEFYIGNNRYGSPLSAHLQPRYSLLKSFSPSSSSSTVKWYQSSNKVFETRDLILIHVVLLFGQHRWHCDDLRCRAAQDGA